MVIKAGSMREEVIIEHRTSSGSLGQAVYTTLATVRGELSGLTGAELSQPQIVGSQSTHKFMLRYRDGVTAVMRLRITRQPDRIFNITYLQADPMLRTLEIFCREVTPAS